MQSTDETLKIYIREAEREALFQCIYEAEKTSDREEINFLYSPEYLEKICLGKTGLLDYAYGQIRKLLKAEYKEWKMNREEK